MKTCVSEPAIPLKQTLDVELPRPRSFEITTSSVFIDQKRAVLDSIKQESLKAIALSSESGA